MEGSGNTASLSVGALSGESARRAPLLGTLNDVLNRTVETGICFNWGPILENMEGTLFPRDLERSVTFFYQESFY
jgi:hypothetical protein